MLEDLVGLITKHLAVEARWVCSAVCCWPKADMRFAPHMSAFRGKADMTFCGKSAFCGRYRE